MSTVRQTSGPVPLAAAVAGLVGESDRHQRELKLRLDCYADGYRNGFCAGAEVGRGQALAEEAAQRREAAGLVTEITEIQRARWSLRGEHRTRGTFGRPHPGDYPGKSGAA